jgi:hypothetical protein
VFQGLVVNYFGETESQISRYQTWSRSSKKILETQRDFDAPALESIFHTIQPPSLKGHSVIG